MPVEIIGEAGTSGPSREWINAECALAIKYLKKVCGEPPPEMELEVQWQEHDLGEYPTIALTWEDAMRGAIFGGEADASPLAKMGRIDADVNDYVKASPSTTRQSLACGWWS